VTISGLTSAPANLGLGGIACVSTPGCVYNLGGTNGSIGFEFLGVTANSATLVAVVNTAVQASATPYGIPITIGSNTVGTFTLTVPFTAQAITFGAIPAQTVGAPLSLSATASSGLGVSFSSSTGSVCTVTGAAVTFVSSGSCTITATQAGNNIYSAATSVTRSFTVNAEAQTITFAAIASQTVGTPLSLTASASSGLIVTFVSSTTSVCTVSGSAATFLTPGSCSITAAQAGNGVFAAATSVTQSFSVSAPVVVGPSIVSVTPNSGTGTTQAFTTVVSDSNGGAALNAIYVLFNGSVTAANGCYVQYHPASNQLFLKNDAGTANLGPLTPGVAGTVANSQCTVSGIGSSYTTSGNDGTLVLALTFASGTAANNIYVFGGDKNGSNSGWVKEGTWGGAAAAPTVVSLTPNAGSASTQTFNVVVSDTNGAAHLNAFYVLFNTSVTAAHGCYVLYEPLAGVLYLKSDDGTTNSAPLTPGGTGSVSNSQCTLSAAGSSYATNGNTATLGLAIAFSGNPLINIYVYAADKNGKNSGFVQEGTWGASAGPPSAISVTPSSGTGSSQIFSAVYSDPNGAANLSGLAILVNTQIAAAHSCYVTYNPHLNLLYLTNDTDTGLSAGVTPGSTASVSNSQCTLAGTGSSYHTVGNTATLTVALTFTGTTAQNVYLHATEMNGSASGWVEEGTWTP